METKAQKQLLLQLCKYIQTKLKNQQATLLTEFAKQYFYALATEDFNNHAVEDLYGALLSHWNLILNYQQGKQKIHIYNPTLEEHSWQSQHTIVEIVIEDMPFLLQSICMEINRHGFTNHLVIHPVFNVKRDKTGQFIKFSEINDESASRECLLHLEIDRQSNPKIIHRLQHDLERVLIDVRATIQDWQSCLGKMQEVIEGFKQQQEHSDVVDFLQWIHDDHFVFLAYREYQLVTENEQTGFRVVPNTGLGILRDEIAQIPQQLHVVSDEVLKQLKNEHPLMMTKATTRSTVHRSVFMDYIGIKQYNKQGEMIGEKRFLGLYSSSAYSCDLKQIPMVASKIKRLQQRSNFRPNSYGARSFLFVLQSLPRDELFQSDEESLFSCAMGVLQLQERQRVRVFVRHDIYGHFVSLLLYVPRERYHTESRKKIQEILLKVFKAENSDFSVQLSESILARLHFIIHSTEGCCHQYDIELLEQKIIETLVEWKDDLKLELHNYFGEAKGNELFYKYNESFSAAYREDVSTRTALLDIDRFEKLIASKLSADSLLYSPLTANGKKVLRFKLFSRGKQASLSKSLPMLENMGVRVCDEHPYEIRNKESAEVLWLHDFGLIYKADTQKFDLENLKPRFEEAFEQCWFRKTEDDGFNQLVLKAGLSWQEVNIFRGLYFYLRQIGITFSQAYIESTLARNPQVVRLLLDYFKHRFDPQCNQEVTEVCEIHLPIEEAIDKVKSLDEDRILRRYLNLIHAAVRTNYFNYPIDEQGNPYFAIKFNSSLISEIPSPIPYFEIFVYSPRVEGIHLRGGAVARGGLRWSDRPEDFRTEILGLMKAQMTKNAVIVPTGAKGGFVVKGFHKIKNKDLASQEVIDCYKIFVNGLLSLTDNKLPSGNLKPNNVVCYDGDDAYLVVAADKGTATFSDYANQLSKQQGFWLDDAFASGGSAGYDHKEMGITARGAWESVKHHFNLLSIDMEQPFSVVGIGGMVGDVFGNGMLLSSQIQLVAAFDHQHIFLDPNPDPQLSFQERQRLFKLYKSSWKDYDSGLISSGGGVYERSLKSISISLEVKTRLAINKDVLTPQELIRAILCAPVDLLWNGGIGTYVKSSKENNLDVGDKANDAVRVNGRQLRCKAVGEGGNLGFTQLGRIEYAHQGGYLNTDSIDNSAGVDCSDHEVNIKILLNHLMKQGDLTEKQRNQLLEQMTEEVAELVLTHNYLQNQAITMIVQNSCDEINDIKRLIEVLEQDGHLNRKLESIPSNDVLEERKVRAEGLYRPEVSVLLSYSKQLMKQELLQQLDSLDEKLFFKTLQHYFPIPLQKSYEEEIKQHSLSCEIVANELVNSLINRMGMVFPYRLMDETACNAVAAVNIYSLVCEVFSIDAHWQEIICQEQRLKPIVLGALKTALRKTTERAMYWFISKDDSHTGVFKDAEHYILGVKTLNSVLASFMTVSEQNWIDEQVENFIHQGVASELAINIVVLDVLHWCLDVVWLKKQTESSLQECAQVFFKIIEALDLLWLRQKISALPKNNVWESLARRTARKEFNHICCNLTLSVLEQSNSNVNESLKEWIITSEASITRYQKLVSMVKTDNEIELEKITVLLKQLAEINVT